MKTIIFRCAIFLVIFLVANCGWGQEKQWRDMHKVKRSETIFGIAKKYGITVNELIKANPDMNTPDYELKKGDYIFIPYSQNKKNAGNENKKKSQYVGSVKNNGLNIGVVLPLHNADGDGKRMIEYYRGLLMACQDLKNEGFSVNVNAWNLPIDGNVSQVVSDDRFSKCDVVFGPLYTKQVKPLADVLKNNEKKLVIPFSIESDDVKMNSCIFQVYQSPQIFYSDVIDHFVYRYSKYHVVVVDCNDKTSDKGKFTFPLRKRLEERGITCNVTNIDSRQELFTKAFSASKPNVVVLNTARSPELNSVLHKIENLTHAFPMIKVSLFGYTEWLMYEKYNKESFFKYDVCIPSQSYYNSFSSRVKNIENRYRTTFGCNMMEYLPRFAIMGYDHGMFFLRGIKVNGQNFDGSVPDKNAMQNHMMFKKINARGGYQNKGLIFIHYNPDKKISLIKF